MSLSIIDITDIDGRLLAPEWLARAEGVHRELRPKLEADYPAQMQRLFRDGARMLVAVTQADVCGVAVWRCYENTVNGRFLYVDDLVTASAVRSIGVGKALLDRCRELAREQDGRVLSLDSGTHRVDAHRFYLRERLLIRSFHFTQALE